MRYVDESREVGTKSGRVVTWMRIICDTLADLPAPDAYDGITICMGSQAFVIADKSKHSMQSSGQWVDITENDGDYTLPPATSNSLGGIMVGSGLTIDSAGMLSGDFSALWDSIYQTEKHLTGAPPLSFMASGNGIEAAVIYGNGQQTGTPTPDNIIMPTFCGVRTAQLFEGAFGGSIGTTGGIDYNEQYDVYYAKVEAGLTYTISGGYYVYAYYSDIPSVGTGNSVDNTRHLTSQGNVITVIDGASWIGVRVNPGDKPMLNLGSTALPYEPYGYKIPITCAGQTTPVYLGQTQTVRRIKKLVLTGEEEWQLFSDNTGIYGAWQFYVNNVINGLPFSSALSNIAGYGATALTRASYQYGVYLVTGGKGVAFQMAGAKDTFTGVNSWKAYLAAQYAAGTPVTVWYVLAEPETAIVNEPLAKIGDYADELHSTDAGISIQTVRGQNTLTIGTTLQPSKISITYF